MTTLLKKWNTLINEELCLCQERISKLSLVEINAAIQESEDEVENVKNNLVEYLVNSTNNCDKQQFIHLNQALLIRLLDKLYAVRNNSMPEKVKCLYHQVGNHLQASLDFIEDLFSNYFDKDEKVPASYLASSKVEISSRLEKLVVILNSDCIDKVLANAIILTIKQFTCCKIEKPISYADLFYYKALLDGLSSTELISTQNVRKTLYQLNFNQLAFVDFESERLHALTELSETRTGKLSALRFEQKIINQYPEKLNTIYDASMPSLKEQVNNWIEAEIKFLENGLSAEKQQSVSIDLNEKINTSLSVAKLAVIIRLLVIDKIIINRTVAPMLRVVARMVTTLQKDEISFGSLETKYHAPDKATITAVRDMLFKWINILGKL